MNHLLKLYFYWLGCLLAAPLALAQTSWKGTSSTAWGTAANWTAGVPTASVDAIIGDANFTGANAPTITKAAACKSLTLGTGTKASTLTVSRGALTISGNLTIGPNGTLNHTWTKAITFTGNWTNSGVYSGYSTQNKSSPVVFAGSAQVVGGTAATTFQALTLNAGSTTTLAANLTVNKKLIINGTLDPGEGAGFIVSGAGTFTVGSGGKLLVRATTFAGNYSISGTKTLTAGYTVDYTASGNQTVDSSLAYSTLRISGGGVKTLAGSLTALNATTATAGILEVAAGTLDLAGFTANRGTTAAGGTLSLRLS